MPNSPGKVHLPGYRNHKASGQAVTTICGRDVYLGPFDSPASHVAYRQAIGEWLRACDSQVVAVPEVPESPVPNEITVVEVIARYLRFAKCYYRKNGEPTNEVRMIKSALDVVRQSHGRTPACQYGPKALKTARDEMIRKDWCRQHINKQVDRVKRMFKWAASEELVGGDVYHRLRCVTGLRRGRSDAKEGRKVTPISEADFQTTLYHLPPVVTDMVRLQRATGARPGEICDLRPCDVQRTGQVWRYVPGSHKSEHYERNRVVFLGPKAQAILMPYLLRPADEFCFSPLEADRKRRDSMHERRTTPLSCGNRPNSNRKPRPRRKPGRKYDPNSYGRAVRRAALNAGVAAWSPHRLRHSFATEVRQQYGIEAVQVLLGHARASVTEIYAERDFRLAERIAAEVG